MKKVNRSNVKWSIKHLVLLKECPNIHHLLYLFFNNKGKQICKCHTWRAQDTDEHSNLQLEVILHIIFHWKQLIINLGKFSAIKWKLYTPSTHIYNLGGSGIHNDNHQLLACPLSMKIDYNYHPEKNYVIDITKSLKTK